ncbi:MAG: hypothetical protein MUQ32_04585 [Chloroflexi bacterium]|nr:hypothetical protein [Chloroflexota bacterium]
MKRTSTLRRTPVLRAWLPLLLVASLAVAGAAGCSSDATASDEYQALAQELAATEQQLAKVTAERDALSATPSGTPSVELPAAAAAALKNYVDAVLAADGDTMLEYVTPEFTFLSYGNEVQRREAYADEVNQYSKGFKVEVLGDQMVLGGGHTYIVAEPERATTPVWAQAFSVFRLVQVDGDWLVDTHRFTGE